MLLFCLFFENKKEQAQDYGNLSPVSLSVMTRAVAALETEGGEQFFGEPDSNTNDFFFARSRRQVRKNSRRKCGASLSRGIAGTFFKQD